jgi:cation diffusion facilitator family transporter
MSRNTLLKTASWISISGNLLLAAVKIIAGLVAGSMAVTADGLDSLSDVIISMMTLIVSLIMAQPPDKEHPFGHHRAETIASSILSFIIFFIGGQLCVLTITKLYYQAAIEMPGRLAVYATIASIAGKGLLSWTQFYFGKKTQSSMLKANGQNMFNDILTSSGILVGLAAGYYFGIPIIDKIIAIIMGVWIMFSAVKIFKGLVIELMDGHEERGPYRAIFQAVREVGGAANPHRARVRTLGSMYVIDLDIEVNASMTVHDAHTISGRIERRIREKLDNVFDIVIHVEPLGNMESNESFGLSEKDEHHLKD